MRGKLRSATAIAEQAASKRWAKRWWDHVVLGGDQRHPRPMRVPVLAVVEQDAQAPNDPELPIQFHEERGICDQPTLVSLERQLSIQVAEGLPLPSSKANLAKLQAEKRQSLSLVGELAQSTSQQGSHRGPQLGRP